MYILLIDIDLYGTIIKTDGYFLSPQDSTKWSCTYIRYICFSIYCIRLCVFSASLSLSLRHLQWFWLILFLWFVTKKWNVESAVWFRYTQRDQNKNNTTESEREQSDVCALENDSERERGVFKIQVTAPLFTVWRRNGNICTQYYCTHSHAHNIHTYISIAIYQFIWTTWFIFSISYSITFISISKMYICLLKIADMQTY